MATLAVSPSPSKHGMAPCTRSTSVTQAACEEMLERDLLSRLPRVLAKDNQSHHNILNGPTRSTCNPSAVASERPFIHQFGSSAQGDNQGPFIELGQAFLECAPAFRFRQETQLFATSSLLFLVAMASNLIPMAT